MDAFPDRHDALGRCGAELQAFRDGKIGTVYRQGPRHAVDDGRQPGPVVRQELRPGDEQVEDFQRKPRHHRQRRDGIVHDALKGLAVPNLVHPFKHRLEGHQGMVLKGCPYLLECHRHALELRIGLICRGEHGRLDDVGGDHPFRRHVLQLPFRHFQVVRNRLYDIRCLLQDAVVLLPAEDAGAHGLGKLQHGRIDARRLRPGNPELLVHLLHECYGLFRAAESVPSHEPQLRDRIRRCLIAAPRPFRGKEYHVLQLLRGL